MDTKLNQLVFCVIVHEAYQEMVHTQQQLCLASYQLVLIRSELGLCQYQPSLRMVRLQQLQATRNRK